MEWYKAAINCISNGIIAVDNSLKPIIINPYAAEIFHLSSDRKNYKLSEIIKDDALCHLIEKTINEDCSFSEELSLEKPLRILKISTNTIKLEDKVVGALIFIQDITEVKTIQKIGSEFVSNVSHELKTPLTSIRGFIETLKNGAINDPEVKNKFLDIIDIEAERLFLLINDILTLSEIETMKREVDIAVVPIERVVADALNILQAQAGKKNISIEYDIEPGLTIKANKSRIMQLVINLTDNAIKYSSDGSRIIIKAYRKNGDMIMSFKDFGIGIPNEHQSRIFQRFYRVDKGRSRNQGGTGLGLSIVKHIVNLYNGDIKVFSEPGKGSEFVVSLPC